MFDGITFSEELDGDRLRYQLDRVKNLMLDGKERTLQEIADKTNTPLSSVSSRVRDLRKSQHGGHLVCSRRISKGTWAYRVIPPMKFDEMGQALMGFEGWAA